MINSKPNLNEPVSQIRVSLHIRLARKCIAYLAKLISNIFRSIDRGHIPEMGFRNYPKRLSE